MGGHCALGARIAAEALTRLRLARRDVERVSYLVGEHMRVARLPEMGLGKQVQLLAHGEDGEAPPEDLPGGTPVRRPPPVGDLRRGGQRPPERGLAPLLRRSAELLAHLRRIEGLRRARELLTGDDLQALGVPPGPRLGAILDHLHERILAGEITTRDEALREARRLAQGHG